jgi:hypothetical protein
MISLVSFISVGMTWWFPYDREYEIHKQMDSKIFSDHNFSTHHKSSYRNKKISEYSKTSSSDKKSINFIESEQILVELTDAVSET